EPEGRALWPELRDHAIAAMGLIDLPIRWQRAIGVVVSAAYDGGLRRYAIIEPGSGQAIVRRLDDDCEVFRVPRPEVSSWYAQPYFSQDGQYLLIEYYLDEANRWIDIWNLERRERVFHQPSGGGFAFESDGRTLVYAPPGKDLIVWDLVTRHMVKRLPLEFQPGCVGLDPEGRRIAVNAAGPPLQVQVRHLDTGQVLNWWTDQVGNGLMSWGQDGRLLAIGQSDGRVFVWDMVRGRLASILQGHAEVVVACQFAPASELLATV